MKAKDIIEQLQRMDPEAEVFVAVKTKTQVYPVAYVTPFVVEPASQRIYISLPQGYSITKRNY